MLFSPLLFLQEKLMSEPHQTSCILNPKQFAFMQSHHSEIEHGLIANKLSDGSFIDAFVESEAYKAVFGDMEWDDVYDRYEDTPGYDNSLKSALRQMLRE